MKRLLGILIMAGFIAGCYYDNEEYLYPRLETGCDTTGITLSQSVRPILQTNCLSCHNAVESPASGGNINLEDYSVLKAMADDGMLFGAITHDPKHSPMPKDGAKLDTCSITKIRTWIDHGALNN